MPTEKTIQKLKDEIATLKSRIGLLTSLQTQNRFFSEENKRLREELDSANRVKQKIVVTSQSSVVEGIGGTPPSAFVTEPVEQAVGECRVTVMLALTKRINIADFEFEKISVSLDSPCRSSEKRQKFFELRDEARSLLAEHLTPPIPPPPPLDPDDLPFE